MKVYIVRMAATEESMGSGDSACLRGLGLF